MIQFKIYKWRFYHCRRLWLFVKINSIWRRVLWLWFDSIQNWYVGFSGSEILNFFVKIQDGGLDMAKSCDYGSIQFKIVCGSFCGRVYKLFVKIHKFKLADEFCDNGSIRIKIVWGVFGVRDYELFVKIHEFKMVTSFVIMMQLNVND